MQRGFIRSLFDLSFTSFVTLRVVKVLYVLSIVASVVAYLAIARMLFAASAVESAVQGGGGSALPLAWLLVIGPLALAFQTLACRVGLELVAVLFRIYERTRTDPLPQTR